MHLSNISAFQTSLPVTPTRLRDSIHTCSIPSTNFTQTAHLCHRRSLLFYKPLLVREPLRATADNSRNKIRIAIPSKGDILDETKDLLAEIGLDVQIRNPRQYVAKLKGMNAEVWLQRPTDIVRKVRSGDVDLGFVGYDLVSEYGGNQQEIVHIHEKLGYGDCRLSIGIPMSWTDCHSMTDFRRRSTMQQLRIATKYNNEAARFLEENGIDNYQLIAMDGALEASTQMGTADCIIDLVSSGVTLRENLLKEIEGGTIIDSSMQFIGNQKHLALDTKFGTRLRTLAQEILERIEAHIYAEDNFNVIANIRGSSMVDVSRRLTTQKYLRGVDGPTVSPVVPPADSDEGMYAISVVIPKKELYEAIQQLRSIGGSGVTVLPVKFIFPQRCVRWDSLIAKLDQYGKDNEEPLEVPEIETHAEAIPNL